MSIDSLKEQARRHEQREEWSKALDLYLKAMDQMADGEDPDIALYNRVGDLQVRLGDVEGAMANYEQAIDLYLEADLANNAIALCRKVTRNAPNRASAFLKMGQIRAKQGFVVDARQNYLTYAEMVQAKGQVDEALKALGEFVGHVPEDVDTRLFLAELLVARERTEDALPHFLAAYRTLLKTGDDERLNTLALRIHELSPETPLPEQMDDVPAAAASAPAAYDSGGFSGFETTSLGFDMGDDEEEEAQATAPVEADEEEPVTADLSFSDFSFDDLGGEEAESDSDEELEPISLDSDTFETDEGPLSLDAPSAGFDEDALSFDEDAPSLEEDVLSLDSGLNLEDDEEDEEDEEDATPLPTFDLGGLGEEEWEDADDDEDVGEPLPMMDLGGLDDDDDADDDEDLGDPLPMMDLGGLDDEESSPSVQPAWEEAAAEVEEPEPEPEPDPEPEPEPEPEAPSAEPTAPDALSALQAQIAVSPDDLTLRQRLVEEAYRSEDRGLLVEAFLELAMALRRGGEEVKARAVFQQVLNLDSRNAVALSALGMESPSYAPPASGRAPTPERETEMPEAPVEPPATGTDDYVDLGALVLDEQVEESTRWVVSAQPPSGDEAADFAKLLSQFKAKVAQNLSVDDAKAHYDLGTAYKEMGLLEEGIAEFQQALRAQPGNLAAYEMLGQSFLDKGEPEIAIRTLERAREVAFQVEDDLLGIYYILGQAHEATGNTDSAREFYEKVFSLDINFKDVTERLRSLR